MKRNKILSLIIVIILLILSITSSVVASEDVNMQSGLANVSIKHGEVSTQEYLFNVVNTFENKGEYNGDFVASVIDFYNYGTINGNVIILTTSIKNEGVVDGDLIAYGRNFYLNKAKIQGDVYAVATNFFTDESTILNSGAIIYGKDVEIKGRTNGNLKIVASSVVLNGKIKGNVTVSANEIVVGNNADISGDLTYQSVNEILVTEHAKIGGELSEKKLAYPILSGTSSILSGIRNMLSTFNIFSIISCGILGVIMYLLFPFSMYKIDSFSKKRFFLCFWIGIGISVIIFPIITLLIISMVGIPIAFLLVGIYMILFYIGNIPAALILGGFFVKGKDSVIPRLFVGLLILGLLTFYQISYISEIITSVMTFVGMGALILNIFIPLISASKKERSRFALAKAAEMEIFRREYDKKRRSQAMNRDKNIMDNKDNSYKMEDEDKIEEIKEDEKKDE